MAHAAPKLERCYNKQMLKKSLAWMLAAAFMAIATATCLAQPAPTGPAFVVTVPGYGVVTPNTGILSASFQVAASKTSANQSLPFVVSSSNGALALSASSDCSKPAQSIGAGTPVTLFTCLDTQKVVGGRYVFVLTVRTPPPFVFKFPGGAGNEPKEASAADCTPTPPSVDVPVIVNVTSSSAIGSIKTSVDT